MAINWFKFSSPASFYPLAGRLIPWFWILAAILIVIGLYLGFVVAPTDYKQGEAYRIMFIHVPAAWMSMFIYYRHGDIRRSGSRAQDAAFDDDGDRHGADRGDVYLCGAMDRGPVG